MTYSIGELDQRVTIQRELRVDDGMGGSTLTWETVATVWAHVRPMSGRELERAQKVGAETMYLVVIHNRSDVDESCTLLWRGKRLNIRTVKLRPRSTWLEMDTEMGVAP
jgi:SPP1 family predicted phage head-tail adaptor